MATSLLSNVSTQTTGTGYLLSSSPTESFVVNTSALGYYTATVVIEQSSNNSTYTTVKTFNISANNFNQDSFSIDIATGYYVRASVTSISGKSPLVSVTMYQGASGNLQQFVPATNDYAGIMAAYNAAVANGGGIVALNPVTYNIGSNTLPRTSGVSYVGIQPQIYETNYGGASGAQDIGAATFSNGTIINGNGTNTAFANNTITYSAFSAVLNGTTTMTISTVPATPIIPGLLLKDLATDTVPTLVIISQLTSTEPGGTLGGRGTYLLGNGPEKSIPSSTLTLTPFNDNFISGSHLMNIGFTNVEKCVQSGATNSMGDAYSTFQNLFATETTDVPFQLLNFEHITVLNLRSYNCAAGPVLGMSTTVTSWGGYGNSLIKSVYDYKSGLNNAPGIFLGAAPDSIGIVYTLGAGYCEDIQANHYNRSSVTQTATITSGSSSIAVTDGTKFPVGMPIWFSVSNTATPSGNLFIAGAVAGNPYPNFQGYSGFNANYKDLGYQVMFVQSQTGNNITLSFEQVGPIFTPSVSTTTYINQQGLPLITLEGGNVNGCDAEGLSAAIMVFNRVNGKLNAIQGGGVKPTGSVFQEAGIVIRNSGSADLELSSPFTNIDCNFGNNTNLLTVNGSIGYVAAGSVVKGLQNVQLYGSATQVSGINLANTKGNNGDITFSTRDPGNMSWTYPGVPFGVRTGTNTTTGTSTWNTGDDRAGFAVYTGTAAATWNWGQGLNANMKGYRQTFKNRASVGVGNTLTIVIGGSDGTWDNISGKTSMVLAAPTASLPGGSMTVVAVDNGSGGWFWAIENALYAV